MLAGFQIRGKIGVCPCRKAGFGFFPALCANFSGICAQAAKGCQSGDDHQNCLALFPRQSQKIFLRRVCFGNSEEHQQVILRLFQPRLLALGQNFTRRVFNLRGLLNKKIAQPGLAPKAGQRIYNFKNHEHKSQAISALLAACQISSRPLRSATAMVFSSRAKSAGIGIYPVAGNNVRVLCRSFSRTRQQEGMSGVI